MPRLRPCDACSRHVFVTETRCPFCQALMPNAPIDRDLAIRSGMSRAQRFAVAAAVAGQTLATGCASTTNPEPGGSASAGMSANPGSANAGSVSRDGASTGSAGIGESSSAGQPMMLVFYGNPMIVPPPPRPPIDAGVAEDDAGGAPPKDAGHRVQPVYGAPIPPKK
jgi:hypothetical protein